MRMKYIGDMICALNDICSKCNYPCEIDWSSARYSVGFLARSAVFEMDQIPAKKGDSSAMAETTEK